MVAKLGDYLFGNVLTSVIAGATTFVWCILFDVPYAVLLGVIVAILDLFPYASTVGGFIVAAVALAVSIPVSVATVVFYIAFRLGEDYLLTPKSSTTNSENGRTPTTTIALTAASAARHPTNDYAK